MEKSNETNARSLALECLLAQANAILQAQIVSLEQAVQHLPIIEEKINETYEIDAVIYGVIESLNHLSKALRKSLSEA